MSHKTRCGSSFLSTLLLVLLVLTLRLIPAAAQCVGPISEVEYEALYSLYNSTNGADWKWRNATDTPGKPWVFNATALREADQQQQQEQQGGGSSSSGSSSYLNDPCSQPWQGLLCNGFSLTTGQCYIVTINLPAYNLQGTLPLELGNILQLEYLYLYDNFLTGPIPSSLGNSTKLIELHLYTNSLTGPIPSTLGNLRQLEYLYLYDNSLTGSIPSSLGDLAQLFQFSLYTNSLTGPIPSSLGKIPKLEYLAFDTNSLTGSIPSSLGKLAKLEYLYLYDNSLTGPIPSSMGDLSLLKILELYVNFFTGPIPSSLGNLARLEFLFIYTNYLTRPVPSSLGDLALLIELYLHTNSLTGPIPSSLGNLVLLKYLELNSNSLTGPIPSSLGNFPLLEYLELYDNSLTGFVPSSLGYLTKLEFLDLDTNSLTGPIPSSLGDLTQLEYLILYSNSLIGPIPSSLSNITKLNYLDLSSNLLTGSIPPSLRNLARLEQLALYSNSLTGAVPSSLGDLTKLAQLLLDTNFLTGSVPSSLGNLSLLDGMFFSTNLLTGPIPSSLGELALLGYVILSNNFLTGIIPSSMRNLNTLRYFNINGNSLNGTLEAIAPTSGEAIAGVVSMDIFPVLEELDVADNAFSGSFPAALFSHPTLSILAASRNCFSGQISVAANVSMASRLETLLLDGLSSGITCRNYVIQLPQQLLPNPGYIPLNFMTGTIPSLLWSLPRLQTLSLVGNGFTGSLDLGGFDPGSSHLQSVSLAYNFISGTIPAALQTYGKFQYFDISNNKFTGTLSADLAFNSTFADAFNVSVNRLSGAFPAAQYDLLAVPNVITTVLDGNLFTFDASSLVEIVALQDGSLQLNIAMGVAAMLPMILMLSWLEARWSSVRRAALPSYWMLYGWANRRPNLGAYIQTSRALWVAKSMAFSLVALLLVALTLGLLLVVMKSDISLRSQFSNYEFQYGWTFSASYLHDSAPMVVCSLSLGACSVMLGTVFFPVDRGSHPSAASTGFADEHPRGYAMSGLNLARRIVGLVFVWLINATVMLTFNGLYLLAVLEHSPHLILIQAALALFKFGWNQSTAVFVITRASDPKQQRTVNIFLLSLQVFNFVLAPCIATAVSDNKCFYQLFIRQPSQAGSGQGECLLFVIEYVNGAYTPVCTQSTGSAALAQPFEPPFVYHYQCGSALLVNYVPVLLYAFVFGSVGAPAALLLCLRFRAAILRCCPHGIIEKIFARLYVMDDDPDLGHHDSTQCDPERESDHSRQPDQKRPLFRGGLFMNQLMLHVVAIVTFGMAAPYLAFILICSFFAELIVMRLLIGRYFLICFSSGFPAPTGAAGGKQAHSSFMLPSSDKEADRDPLEVALIPSAKRASYGPSTKPRGSYGILWWSSVEEFEMEVEREMSLPREDLPSGETSSNLLAAAQREVEEALEGVWAYPYDGMWLVVLVAQLFWALLFFDMVGDVYGYEAGLQAMVATMLCLPLLTYWLARVGLHCKPYFDSKIWRTGVSGFSAAGAGQEDRRAAVDPLMMATSIEKMRSDFDSLDRESEIINLRVGDMNSAFSASGAAEV